MVQFHKRAATPLVEFIYLQFPADFSFGAAVGANVRFNALPKYN